MPNYLIRVYPSSLLYLFWLDSGFVGPSPAHTFHHTVLAFVTTANSNPDDLFALLNFARQPRIVGILLNECSNALFGRPIISGWNGVSGCGQRDSVREGLGRSFGDVTVTGVASLQ